MQAGNALQEVCEKRNTENAKHKLHYEGKTQNATKREFLILASTSLLVGVHYEGKTQNATVSFLFRGHCFCWLAPFFLVLLRSLFVFGVIVFGFGLLVFCFWRDCFALC